MNMVNFTTNINNDIIAEKIKKQIGVLHNLLGMIENDRLLNEFDYMIDSLSTFLN